MLNQNRGANAGAAVVAERTTPDTRDATSGLVNRHPPVGLHRCGGRHRATVQGPLQEFATAEAMVIPRGQRLLIHSAKALMSEPAAAFIAPSHTAPELIDEGFVFGVADVGLTSSRACRI